MRSQRPAFPVLLLFLGAALFLAACGGGAAATGSSLPHGTYPVPDGPGDMPPPSPPPDGGGTEPSFPELTGGVLVTIDTGGEIWRWWVTNPVTAAQLERAWNGTPTERFGGHLRAGPGAAGHNAPWSWHVDPEANGFGYVFFAPRGPSPGTPSQCENQLSHWLSLDTLFIAYPFTLVAFDDRRK